MMRCPECGWSETAKALPLFSVYRARPPFAVAVSCPICGRYWWTGDQAALERWSRLSKIEAKLSRTSGRQWAGWPVEVRDMLPSSRRAVA
jgi:uncharacterized protein with PIN domain